MSKLLLKKLKVKNFPNPEYFLTDIALNDLVGKSIEIEFTGHVECINCQREIKKTFNQGYCFPCAQSLPQCDICSVRPEKCIHETTGDLEWGKKHCLIPHAVYLANSAGLKIGVTREFQKETRWVDQGAIMAVQIARTPKRKLAGELEVLMKEHISDKANWRKLITGQDEEFDLVHEFYRLKDLVPAQFQKYLLPEDELEVEEITYPVNSFLTKAKTFNAEKAKVLSGELTGIRGQYLFIGEQAINIRKYQGYEVRIEH